MSKAPEIDLKALEEELNALRDELRAEMGEEDLDHLRKMIRWERAAAFVGWATSGIAPNPLSVGLLSTSKFTRWAMFAHHILHRGYDKIEG
ncbi:MAG: fatty acid desaturase, partial [Myxococcota bacterium]|nr:fatty acid desaturase [Myxococcota bacterium]